VIILIKSLYHIKLSVKCDYFNKVPGLGQEAWADFTRPEILMSVVQRPALREEGTLV